MGGQQEGRNTVTHRNAAGTHVLGWVGLAIAMIACAPAPAAAQAPGRFERGAQLVSAFVGSLSSDLEDASTGVERELDSATTFGGSYRYVLTPRLSVGATVEYASTSVEAERGGDDGNDDGNDDDEDTDDDDDDGEDGDNGEDDEDDDGASVDVLYVTGGLNFNIRRGGRFIPFVTAGGGFVSLDVSGAGTESTPTGMVGAGLLFAMTDRILLRADIRDYIYDSDTLSAAALQALMFSDTVTGVVNDLSMTAGVSWQF